MTIFPLLLRDETATQAAARGYRDGLSVSELATTPPFQEYLDLAQEAALYKRAENKDARPLHSYLELFRASESIPQFIALGSFETIYMKGVSFARQYWFFPSTDFFQEAIIRYIPDALKKFDPHRHSTLRNYLNVILTNKAIDMVRSMTRQLAAPSHEKSVETETSPALPGKGKITNLGTIIQNREPLTSLEQLELNAGDPIFDEEANGFEQGRSSDKPIERFYRLANLTPLQQYCLEQRFLFDQKPADIAVRLETTVKVVSQQLKEAKQKIGRHMSKDTAHEILGGYE